jgi:hypothetical protein
MCIFLLQWLFSPLKTISGYGGIVSRLTHGEATAAAVAAETRRK